MSACECVGRNRYLVTMKFDRIVLFLANKENYSYVQISAIYCNWNSEHVLTILDIRYNLKVLGSWTDSGRFSTSEQLNLKFASHLVTVLIPVTRSIRYHKPSQQFQMPYKPQYKTSSFSTQKQTQYKQESTYKTGERRVKIEDGGMKS
jgi:hypothetical protein